MEPVRLDDLPDDVGRSLAERAKAEGVTQATYVLELVKRELGAAMSWATWLAELAHDEAVTTVGAAAALAQARSERSAQLEPAVLGGNRP